MSPGSKGGEKAGKPGTGGQLEELVKRAEEAREAVCQTLGSRYDSLAMVVHDTAHLHHRVANALEDLTSLHNSIEQEVLPNYENVIKEFLKRLFYLYNFINAFFVFFVLHDNHYKRNPPCYLLYLQKLILCSSFLRNC